MPRKTRGLGRAQFDRPELFEAEEPFEEARAFRPRPLPIIPETAGGDVELPLGMRAKRPYESSDPPEKVFDQPESGIPNLEEWKRAAKLQQSGFRSGSSPAFERARRELNLTPQEQYLYRHHLDNLARGGFVHGPAGTPSPGDWPPRTLDPNERGSISTLYQTSRRIDGRYYNLPTVWDGQIVDEDQSLERAKQAGLENFPSYSSEAAAEKRYTDMHKYLEQDMRDWFHP